MKIRAVGAELFHMDRLTDDVAISHFFAILRTRLVKKVTVLSFRTSKTRIVYTQCDG